MTNNTLNVVPIKDPNRGWREWYIDEIYTGPTGTGRIVPNVNDAIWSWDNGKQRVTHVDYTTGISTWIKYIPPKDGDDIDDEDILLGASPGHLSESYRCYIDQAVTPHTLACDARLHLYGSTTSYVKIFKGTDISETGTVISAQFDNSGNMLGENIPLEVVNIPGEQTVAIKTPMVGYTAYQMDDGEIVTVVAYDDVGAAVSICHLLVMNTAFVRDADASKKYVTGISIETPFKSPYDEKLLEYPANVNVQAMDLMGVVHYSNGNSVRLPVDGTKFKVNGLSRYIATIVGQKVPLVAAYQLGENEVCYGLTVRSDKSIITEPYAIKTIEADGAYSVKLFTYPVWVDEVVGYRLEHWLYNLERKEVHYVTPYVELGHNSPAFNGRDIGTVQALTFAIDLNKVDGRFAHYRHIQTIDISLLSVGTEKRTRWLVRFNPSDTMSYGDGVFAGVDFTNVNYWKLNLSSGFNSAEEWLRNVFYNTLPLHMLELEVEAPLPTHFVLCYGDKRWEHPMSMWDQTFLMNEMIGEGQNVYLEFFRRVPGTDLQLGISALSVRQGIIDDGNGGWNPDPEASICLNPAASIGRRVEGKRVSDNVLDWKILGGIVDEPAGNWTSTDVEYKGFPAYLYGTDCQWGYLDTDVDEFFIVMDLTATPD